MNLLHWAWDRASLYLPVVLMGVLALGTWWLVRVAPVPQQPVAERAPSHEPDYVMKGFAVRTYAADGRLRNDMRGAELRHYPDTDTLEILDARIRIVDAQGRLTTARATRALTNGTGSQVQLFGQAVVVRETGPDPQGRPQPPLEFRSEFLHAFIDDERVTSDRPVQMLRGGTRVEAGALSFDNLARSAELRGGVRAVLQPRSPKP